MRSIIFVIALQDRAGKDRESIMKIPFLTTESEPSEKEFVIGALISDANVADKERRANGRVPFFQPSLIAINGEAEGRPAFTRDIGADGIGFLHNFSFNPQILEVSINISDGKIVRLIVDAKWCVACGDGWYISGGTIVDTEIVK